MRKILMRLQAALIVCVACVAPSHDVLAQAAVAAERKMDFTVFAGLTGTYTGLSGGKNAAVTAGVDLNLPSHFGVRPSFEVRGTTPFTRGSVDTQKDALGGVRGEFSFGRIHPYVDFLAGRGAIHYVVPYGTPEGFFVGGTSVTTIYSPGLGARFSLGHNVSGFADVQIQRWDTPVSLSGHLFAKPLTGGLVYRFPFGKGRRAR